MKKFNKKGKKHLCTIALASMLLLSMTACGNTEETDASQFEQTLSETEKEQESDIVQGESGKTQGEYGKTQEAHETFRENPEQGIRYFGEVTAIDGNSITVEATMLDEAVGQKPEGDIPAGQDSPELPSGEMPEREFTDEKSSSENPDDQAHNENPAEREPAPEPKDFENLSRETMTIEVTDSTIFTKELEEASLKDLQVGDSISFNLLDSTVISLHIGEMNPAAGEQRQDSPSYR